MDPNTTPFDLGEYAVSVVHPTALLALALCTLILLVTSSKSVLIPFLIIGTFMTAAQRIHLGQFDFTMMRLLLIGWIGRVVLRSEGQPITWNRLDSMVTVYAIVGAVVYVLLWMDRTAVVFQLGRLFDIFLIYFLLRISIQSSEQIFVFVRALAWVMLLSSVFMLVEHLAHFNLFSIFGGVRETVWIREGRLRAQGSFSHAIMAGTFGAAFLPLFWALYFSKISRDRVVAVVGIVGSVTMTFAAASSGAVVTLLASIVAVLMWSFRQYVVLIRRAAIPVLFGLHLVMEAPVWHLISRVDLVGGSTGYHRYRLIDSAIRNFSEWAVIGVRGTAHWGWMMHDVTNQFIKVAVDGGLIALVVFVLLLGSAFRITGRARQLAFSHSMFARLHWAWGAVLFAHIVSFLGVSYFGQMNYFWYFTLAAIASLDQIARGEMPASEAQ